MVRVLIATRNTHSVTNDQIEADVVIIGAGPSGLFQVFELGLLGIKAHVIDALPHAGGQCIELYPDKPIYDIPAVPVIQARELIDRLMQQIRPFDPAFYFEQRVVDLEADGDGRYRLITSTGSRFLAKQVIIAGGAGSFEPVKLKVSGFAPELSENIAYSVKAGSDYTGKDVVILGGGDSALDWALELQRIASSVLLIHRSETFKAAPASVNRMRRLCENDQMQCLQGNVVGVNSEQGLIKSLDVSTFDGLTRLVELDQLLVFFGLSPRSGPIDGWQLVQRGKQIVVDTEKFETSRPGIYAVGDINWYPGKKKLILSGFHEAALAAFAIKSRMQPDKKVALQYTTTSPLMHARLGVQDPYQNNRESAA